MTTVTTFKDFEIEVEKNKTSFSYDFWKYTFENLAPMNGYFLKDRNETKDYIRNFLFIKKPYIAEYSIKKGEFELLKYLVDNNFPTNNLIFAATQENRFDILQYLKGKKIRPEGILDSQACEKAAENNNLEILTYLHDIMKCPFNKYTAWRATRNNNLEMLKYLVSRNISRENDTLTCNAASNNLEILTYAHDSLASSTTQGEVKNSFQWDHLTPYHASRQGNFECLKYAIENSCPFNVSECLEVAKDGEIISYLKSFSKR